MRRSSSGAGAHCRPAEEGGCPGGWPAAIVKVHWANGFVMERYRTEGVCRAVDFNVALLAMALLISGAGKGSVDKLLSRR